MIRIFAGYDEREALGFHVFMKSLIRTSSQPFALTPLTGDPRDGTNAFTYARFLVPYLCDFKGTALFVDGSDMLLREDIAELAALANPQYAVQVVKHDYMTRHPRKYLGTPMEADNHDYPRKNWSSVVVWNCEHPKHRWMEPEALKFAGGQFLHRFSWLRDEEIGALPEAWNLLVGEQESAKLAHFTLGIPGFAAYADYPYAGEWLDIANSPKMEPHGIRLP